MSTKSYLRPVPTPTVALAMQLDPFEFAKALERLRHTRGQSQEAAAAQIGVSMRQYTRWLSENPPTPRLSTVEKIAGAYDLDVAELLQEITKGKGSLSDRLDRLERDIAYIRAALAILIPAYAEAEAEAQLARVAQSIEGTPDANATQGQVA